MQVSSLAPRTYQVVSKWQLWISLLALFSHHHRLPTLELAFSPSYHHVSLPVPEFSHPYLAAPSTSRTPLTPPVLMSGASWGLDHNWIFPSLPRFLG